ncbi:MAG: type II secretion system protein, partial [Bacteriovoracaceae bacterium]|nr:type II secretion system protein [Bacteriovoracaceae bacterium]
MKISTSTKIKHRIRKTNKKAGFSLLEILIALTLMGVTLSLVFRDGVSQRDKLERSLEYLQRAVRFAQAETIFRGSLVRLNFTLGTSAHYTVEYGPSGRFVIPLDPYQDKLSLTLSEKAAQEKRQAQLNLDFRPVPNFARKEQDFAAPLALV